VISKFDAILVLSFGGPERPEDVMPFLENVVRGKNVPQERLLEVAKHYELFDGASPINAHVRVLLTALVNELNAYGLELPVYWGNRNWHPLLTDTVRDMADDGVRNVLAFVPSAFGSYSSCRQYREDIDAARREVGHKAPKIDKLRLFYNHPGFIEAVADRIVAAIDDLSPKQRSRARLLYTAHSLPKEMAGCSPYERQLHEACRLVTDRARMKLVGATAKGKISSSSQDISNGHEWLNRWQLAFQSRSGPPSESWLGPDIRDSLRQMRETDEVEDVVVVPIGFSMENMEVAFDLDVEVGELCDELELNMIRTAVAGNHPRFVQMIRELIVERIDPASPRLALGAEGPSPDECSQGCCLPKQP
jgi:ferrochelatase